MSETKKESWYLYHVFYGDTLDIDVWARDKEHARKEVIRTLAHQIEILAEGLGGIVIREDIEPINQYQLLEKVYAERIGRNKV